jgi:homocysteine S-methyltransferase
MPNQTARFLDLLDSREVVLTEGGIIERLRRELDIPIHPRAANAPLLYTDEGRAALVSLWREYLDVGRARAAQMLVCTPTWRANAERLAEAGLPGVAEVARDAVRLLKGIRSQYGDYSQHVFIGGLLGCRGDAYRASEALDCATAAQFHREQAEALAQAGSDFLMAATMPAFSEALGMAKAMAQTGSPYIVSFVLRPNGTLLDGAPVADAIARIDDAVDSAPSAYLANCVHPDNLMLALEQAERLRPGTTKRLMGLQGNTSRKSPEELDGADTLQTDDPEAFASSMLKLHERFGLHILGGCCGTDQRHIAALARMAL